jgi:hypothetical protein
MGTAFHNATGPAESDTGKGILQVKITKTTSS